MDWKIIFTSSVIAAVITALLTRLNDRAKAARESRNVLRGAYAEWLTQIRLLEEAIDEQLPIGSNQSERVSEVQTTDALTTRIEGALSSSNIILQIEKSPPLTEQVERITNALYDIRKLFKSIPAQAATFARVGERNAQSASSFAVMRPVAEKLLALLEEKVESGEGSSEILELRPQILELQSEIDKGLIETAEIESESLSGIEAVKRTLADFNEQLPAMLEEIRRDRENLSSIIRQRS